jgi:outer membrane protein assembly factor BamD
MNRYEPTGMRILSWLILGLILPVGCASQQTEPATAQHYTENARRAYEAALDEYKDRSWESATSMFEQVKREYSYSRYARLAELRLADIAYEQQKFPEAVTAYRTFVHDHPNDADAAYARFRVSKGLFEQTGESVLLPPLEERDLAAANDAYSALQSFIGDYPLYERRPEADYMLEFVTGLLARHELYVARFYLNQDKFEPAVDRIHYALKRFKGSGLEPEALVLLGETRLKMHQYAEAREVFTTVLAKYHSSAFTLSASRFLKYLDEHPQPTSIAVK